MWKNGDKDDEDVLDHKFTLLDYGLSFNYKDKDIAKV